METVGALFIVAMCKDKVTAPNPEGENKNYSYRQFGKVPFVNLEGHFINFTGERRNNPLHFKHQQRRCHCAARKFAL